MEFSGELKGIKSVYLRQLESLCRNRVPHALLIPPDLLHFMAALTDLYHREIGVYITRSGLISHIIFGRHNTADLPQLKGRVSFGQIRCIHTHPGGSAQLSRLDLYALRDLHLESITAAGVRKGDVTALQCAVGMADESCAVITLAADELPHFDYEQFRFEQSLLYKGQSKGQKPKGRKLQSAEPTPPAKAEQAILVALESESALQGEGEILAELRELAHTAGVEVLGQLTQPRRTQDFSSYIGKGKLVELSHLLQATKANLVICDDELKPHQQRAMEQATGVKVIDRTMLILDIFAHRARSREGKLQVELAQLNYLLPRLTGEGTSLSRLGGGIGTRGPGETKLETDRRRIRQKISALQKDLSHIRQNRETQRKGRSQSGLPLIGLVGYTNAGKTTFLQRAVALSGTATDIPQGENKLFATLDPIVRKVRSKDGREILLSDTVGFIQKLPHHLLHAFLATLEEVQNADLLIHVLDASHAQAADRAQIVRDVLAQLGCQDKPVVTLLNKTDKVGNRFELERLAQVFPHPVSISLLNATSLDPVWQEVNRLLTGKTFQYT